MDPMTDPKDEEIARLREENGVRNVEILALKAELRGAHAGYSALKRRAEAAEKRAKAAGKELEACRSELGVKSSKLARYARSILQLKKELSDATQLTSKQVEIEDKSEGQAVEFDDYALVNTRWDGREKSRIVQFLAMNAPDRNHMLTYADIGQLLGRSAGVINGKMSKNAWSLEDLIRVAKKAGFEIRITKKETNTGLVLDYNEEAKQITMTLAHQKGET